MAALNVIKYANVYPAHNKVIITIVFPHIQSTYLLEHVKVNGRKNINYQSGITPTKNSDLDKNYQFIIRRCICQEPLNLSSRPRIEGYKHFQ